MSNNHTRNGRLALQSRRRGALERLLRRPPNPFQPAQERRLEEIETLKSRLGSNF